MSLPITDFRSKDRSSLERTMQAGMRRLLGAGTAMKTRFTNSLRVGSGSLTALDGFDGYISADGAQAAIFFRDRTNSTQYSAWYRDGNLIRLYDVVAGDLWQISASTGLISTAWTSATFTNSWANFGGGIQGAGYRLNKLGQVEFCGLIKTGAAGTVAFTIPSNMWPAASRVFSTAYWTGSAWTTCSVTVNASGQVVPESTGAGGAGVGLEFVMPL